MPKSRKEIAKEYGIGSEAVSKLCKRKGISNKQLTDNDVNELNSVLDIKNKIIETNDDNVKKLYIANEKFTPNVRRIDLSNASSMEDTLQDAKERYRANEEIIQKLQNEVDTYDVTINAFSNGTVSSIPQLPMIEKFVKLNIALRNQIIEIEDKLGRHGKTDDNDPFK